MFTVGEYVCRVENVLCASPTLSCVDQLEDTQVPKNTRLCHIIKDFFVILKAVEAYVCRIKPLDNDKHWTNKVLCSSVLIFYYSVHWVLNAYIFCSGSQICCATHRRTRVGRASFNGVNNLRIAYLHGCGIKLILKTCLFISA